MEESVIGALYHHHLVLSSIYSSQQRRRRCWTRGIFLNRTQSQYHRLIPSLLEDNDALIKYFRLDKSEFLTLLNLVRPHIEKMNTNWRTPISPGHRLCLTLRYLSSGDSFTSLSYNFRVSKSSIGKIIPETCKAIWDVLAKDAMKPPASPSDWLEIAQGFSQKWNFPMCVGAIDGKHVAIQKPHNAGSEFFNHKGYHSIVLLGVCDANYRFTKVDIGDSGRHSDGGIFSTSEIGIRMKEHALNLPPPHNLYSTTVAVPFCLVGDNAFLLMENLMRPYPDKSLSYEKLVFKYRLSRARRCIENTFDILVQRWRVLRKTINVSEKKAVDIVRATVVLHNWLQKRDMKQPTRHYITSAEVDSSETDSVLNGAWNSSDRNELPSMMARPNSDRQSSLAGKIRQKFASHFVSPAGEVDWQRRIVNQGK